jgi:hypothetical protein
MSAVDSRVAIWGDEGRVRFPDLMELLMSIIDVPNTRLLSSGFDKLAKFLCDLARKAEGRRIAREVANDVCALPG